MRGRQPYAHILEELRQNGQWVRTTAARNLHDKKNNRDGLAQVRERHHERVDDERQMPQSRAEKGYHAERRGGKAGVILVLILLVFISPLIKGTVGGIIGFIVALILLPFILVLGTGAVVLALFAIAVIAIGAGIGACVTATPAFGALGIGIGLILLSLGLAGLVFFVWAASRALPAILRRFTDFCGNILNRGKKGGDRA